MAKKEKSKTLQNNDENVNGNTLPQHIMHTDDLSSDDEDENVNTVGRIPLHWYDAFDHIGYLKSGEKVRKRNVGDKIDIALANNDDALAGRTVYDMYNDREIVLSDRDLEIIKRLQSGAFAHPEHNDTPDYIDYYSSIKEVMPISAMPEPKRRFTPSKYELMKVMKIVKAIKEGRYVTSEQRKQNKKNANAPYMIWDDSVDDVLAESRRYKYHLPAPKLPLPGHAESYNPPPEYLLDEEELKEMGELDPNDRQYNFIPKSHDCLRHVSGYDNFVKERFERCLDLYLCPRKLKSRLNINPDALIPKLPSPRELKPYPNNLCLQYIGHAGAIRSISISPDGQYLVSGSDDCTLRLWEIDNGLCRYIWKFNDPVVHVEWNPNYSHHVVAAAIGKKVILVSTGTGDKENSELLESFFEGASNWKNTEDIPQDDDVDDSTAVMKKKKRKYVKWASILPDLENNRVVNGTRVGPRVELIHEDDVSYCSWHHKGDYIVTVVSNLSSNSVSVHQVSKGKSQYPFRKNQGKIECVRFHPSRPFLFVATQHSVKVYHLQEQKMVKKLLSGCKWISSMDIHSSGDHVIVGSYDRRVVWFDLDLSSMPYKTLKFHDKAIRSVQYHSRYPLMASASDDGSVHIFHATVYDDLSRNPLIVPLKILQGHKINNNLGVLTAMFHPRQPWIFSGGSDGVINLYQDI